jgi:hypothetical protein
MRASEWQFLCAVHESPKSCCAIDYCCHTLDWATNIVTSQKIFPSRLSLAAGDAIDDRGAGVKHLVNIFRRLHRIFAHAWFQHRSIFWQVEGQTGLYVLFKTVCDNYELLPAENYKLPPEAEGLEPVEDAKVAVPSILKSDITSGTTSSIEEDFVGVGRTNTRRHIRQSPSVGSAVTTVMESDEEDPDVTQKLEELKIHEGEEDMRKDDDEGETEIPVIVESYEVDEHRHASPAEPESETVDVTEAQEPIQDDSTNSVASSWDRLSSDSLEEKSESPKQPKAVVDEVKEEKKAEEDDKDETKGGEAESKVEVDDEATETKATPEPESNENPKVEESHSGNSIPTEKEAEETPAKES